MWYLPTSRVEWLVSTDRHFVPLGLCIGAEPFYRLAEVDLPEAIMDRVSCHQSGSKVVQDETEWRQCRCVRLPTRFPLTAAAWEKSGARKGRSYEMALHTKDNLPIALSKSDSVLLPSNTSVIQRVTQFFRFSEIPMRYSSKASQ